jgi:hypothetical protein
MEKYCVLTILSFIVFNYSIESGVKMSFLEDPNVICILSGGSLVIYFLKLTIEILFSPLKAKKQLTSFWFSSLMG